ncbi:universal stress protein [Pengzhenrongella sp.]|jgi:nucleotide-binding universal stress UspA family protein|uniref:universal stress protein n=1 Tax=Pengzhenrongella sp. TaxID=2888820 RepID=UPI002F94515A
MTIVIGYVPTPVGEAALARAGEEARLHGERLVVVSSTRGESNVDPSYPQTPTLMRLVTELGAQGVEVEVRHKETSGGPADEILDAAEDVGASLIVIGLRKRTAVGKLMLGSTAQTVILKAHCSVLGVRT